MSKVHTSTHITISHCMPRVDPEWESTRSFPVLMVSLARMAAAKLSPSIPTAMMTTRSERLVYKMGWKRGIYSDQQRNVCHIMCTRYIIISYSPQGNFLESKKLPLRIQVLFHQFMHILLRKLASILLIQLHQGELGLIELSVPVNVPLVDFGRGSLQYRF